MFSTKSFCADYSQVYTINSMKKSFAIFLVAILLFGITACQVQAAEPHAWITPNSVFYGYKIFGEWVKEKIVSIGGVESELSYVSKRIRNRAEELITLEADGKVNTPAYIEANNRYHNLETRFNTILNEIEIADRYKLAQDELNQSRGLGEEDYTQVHYRILNQQKMDEIQNQITEANNSGDNAKVAELRAEFNQAKQNDAAAIAISKSIELQDKQNVEQIKNLLPAKEKVDYGLLWANKYKQDIENASQNEIFKNNTDQFDKAKKAIDDLIFDLKTIPLDKVDDKKLDDLFAVARKILQDTSGAIGQKILNGNLIKPLPETKSQKTTITPTEKTPEFVPKKKLETIPSESVSTETLMLSGRNYDNFNGQVGEEFTHYFSATGGLPPYRYQLETGVGFPPQKIILDANGKLSGTPTIAGDSTFGVCVVDTAGKSDCHTVTMTVDPAEEALPQCDVYAWQRSMTGSVNQACVSTWDDCRLHTDGDDKPCYDALDACRCNYYKQVAPQYNCSESDIPKIDCTVWMD